MRRGEKRRNKLLLGSLKGFSDGVVRLFELGASSSSHGTGQPLFQPHTGTALDVREVQTYAAWKVQNDFRKLHFRQRRRLKNKIVYLQPIGPFPASVHSAIQGLNCSLFQLLQTFMGAFFYGLTVRLRETVMVDEINCKTRIHPRTDKIQLLVKDVLTFLKGSIPSDGYCIVGITWVDLYPSEEWNFVLGEAACEDGCAVVSFGHYEPQSFNKEPDLTQDTKVDYVQATKRIATDKELRQDLQAETEHLEQTSYKYEHQATTEDSISSCKKVLDSSAPKTVSSECGNKFDKKGKNASGSVESCSKCSSFSEPGELSKHLDVRGSVSLHPGSISQVGFDTKKQHECQQLDTSGSLSEKFAELDKVDGKIIWRLFRGISHETSHVTGMAHCAYYTCAMNESKSIQEAESQPLFMCPVCLRKLQKAIGFDVVRRYEALHAFFATVCRDLPDLDEEQDISHSDFPQMATFFKSSLVWLQSVLAFIQNDSK